MPSPARSTGTRPIFSAISWQVVVVSGVVIATGRSCTSRVASKNSTREMAATRSRNSGGLVSVARSRASLCCTSGCVETWTGAGMVYSGSARAGREEMIHRLRR
jgi:hypothetical protein